VCLNSPLGWAFISVGSFIGIWIISYGTVQSIAPDIYGKKVGRLIGTVLSGWIYQTSGLQACLWLSNVFYVRYHSFLCFFPNTA